MARVRRALVFHKHRQEAMKEAWIGRWLAGLPLQPSACRWIVHILLAAQVGSIHAAQQNRGRVGEQLTARGGVQDGS